VVEAIPDLTDPQVMSNIAVTTGLPTETKKFKLGDDWLKTKIDNKKNRYAIEDDGYPVAIVVGETTANLIASTPEILEALKEIEKFANDEFPTSSSKLKHSSPSYDEVAGMKYDLLQRILIITHKAIAKSEGK